jgi:cytoskeletal protein RodZ
MLAMQSKHSEAEIEPPVTAAYPWRRYVFLALGLVLLLGAIFSLTAYFNRSASTPPQVGEASTQNGATAGSADELKSDPTLEAPSEEPPQQGTAPGPTPADSTPDQSVQEEEVPSDLQDEVQETPSTPQASPESTVNALAPEVAPSQAPEEEVSDAADALVLEVEAVELTWFKVQIDKDEVREVTIEANDRVVFTAREQFDLIIGNAGGVDLQLNGRPIPVPGKSGQVVTMRLP